MQRIRHLIIVFFIAALAVFGIDRFYLQSNKDTTPPVLTLPKQDLECSVNDSEELLLVGAEAFDDKDGDLTSQIFIESLSPFISENTRLLTAVVVDQAGNVSKATRNVVYTDYKHPRFSMSAPLNFYLGTIDLTSNIGAQDYQEGDISANVKVTSTYTMKDNYGDYPMEFLVSNAMGDTIRFTATVTLMDVTTILYAPTLELTKYLVYADADHKLNLTDYVKSVTINSRVYENLTVNGNKETGDKDTENPDNESGNTSSGLHEVVAGVSSSMIREDREKPAEGNSEVNGDKPEDDEDTSETNEDNASNIKLTPSEDYPESENLPKEVSLSDIKIVSAIDYETPGTYEVSYYYTYNDYTSSVRLVVIVE